MVSESQCIMLGLPDVRVDLDHLVKIVPAGLQHCFPFVMNKNLGRDSFRLCKYPFSPKTFNHYF